jgi:glycerol-3-phosphate cytidylyltransferase
MLLNKIKDLKTQGLKIGITFSTFDLLHAGHIAMLAEAKNHCDYLIAGLQTDPTLDRPDSKNKPVQSIVERQITLGACRYVDEIVVYETEKDLIDLILTLPIDVRILGTEYEDTNFTGRNEGTGRGIHHVFNKRDHSFSSSSLRKRVAEAENNKVKNNVTQIKTPTP